ncbi:MAG: HEPN domain-containing protein [Hyphomonas sp.]|nr:HEPN domain-containing protein [Hyphomonas sp.]MBU3920679.1 HEPN domain-containing protein [Alphaproteobacteria bacterium]MBU4063584.1 HEPN domain-containing protein [Alphaproteobacteria bacterium]MBU4163265.1 HEPN domain-containing protein [Alphaproteobacteria bacterium]
MRTDLDHLPHGKQRELARVTEILFEEFTDAMKSASSPKKKEGRILKIILFGSYARGTWVDEPHTAKGYLSDYDLLIVVNQQSVVDFATYWYRAEDRIMRETGIRTPVNFIVHTMDEVNSALSQGQYFFTDIIKEGIALYDLKGSTLFVTPQPQTADEALATAEKHFEERFPRIEQALTGGRFYVAEGNLRDAAFTFHQAVERAYTCLLLVETNYSPSTHSIKFLRSLAEQIDPDLIAAWPRETKQDRRLFELLKRAYVDARYSEHYAITAEELAWLGERADILRALVEKRSRGKIEQLRDGAVTGD